MTNCLEEISFEKVVEILKNSLDLDDSVSIAPETRLKDLGAEDIDVFDILFRLGIPISKYVLDFETRKIGRYEKDLISIANLESAKGNISQYVHLKKLAYTKNMQEAMNVLNAADCLSLGQYSQKIRPVALTA